jgi:FMN reductase [NAD(P)H]
MIHNQVIDAMLNRKSIRKYTAEQPSDAVIETIVRAGQQAPFAYQLGDLLLSRDPNKNPFHAPLYFTVCVDSHRFELIMGRRKWKPGSNDLSLMVIGIQDAALMTENMVIAAESLGLGSCLLGAAPYQAAETIQQYKLPPRVFPLVGLAMGYPAEDPPIRPRYPLEFTLFEDEYPQFDEQMITTAMQVMDDGYLAQDYYRKANYIIPLNRDRRETFSFENYSWTEHIARKIGLWQKSSKGILAAFKKCGFQIPHEPCKPS